MTFGGGWSTQQLVEFLAAVSAAPDEQSAVRGALERAVEAVEAEIGVALLDGDVAASVGFARGQVPVDEIREVVEGGARTLRVDGLGELPAAAIGLDDEQSGRLVLARLGEPFRVEELSLLRGMVRVLTLTLRMLRLLAAERSLRESHAVEAEARLARMREAALTDNLTGLLNHRAFQESLVTALARCRRGGDCLSLVMLDLDGLKQVNDTLGHQAGDDRLRALATALRDTAGDADISFRLGGDEFAAILAGEEGWSAFRFAQRLQCRLAADANGVTVTAGIAEAEPGVDRDTLVRRADLALIEAKSSHRQTLIYSPGLEPKVVRRRRADEQHHLKTLATALARAVDAKDSYTRSHCETVSELCALIGSQLRLDPDRLVKLRRAGLLHDVGKIGIPDAILQKPSRLDDDEFEIMKTHSVLGHSIVRGAELDEEAHWILHHHERPDGRGYPHGLSGDEVPLESRIILVADAFEAITADRPYRRGRSDAEAFAELERHAGTQFDSACVAELRRALSRRGTGLPAPPLAPSAAPV